MGCFGWDFMLGLAMRAEYFDGLLTWWSSLLGLILCFLIVRASTSICANFFPFCTSKIYFFHFTHIFLQNTHISLSIIHIYSNKIFIFFLTLWTVTVRGERKEKRGERKKNKKIIYTVNSNYVYIHGYYSFARLLCIFRHFYKDWCGGFLG